MKNKTSENMQKMYADKRSATLTNIQNAIDFIQGEGREVTKKELMEINGLSTATFSKPHVKELLEKNQVCQFKVLKKLEPTDKKAETQSQIIERLSKELKKANSVNQDLTISLEKKTNDCKKLKDEKKKLDNDYQLLKGKYQMLLEQLEVLGVDLAKFNVI